jgi:hypothetical protein
MQPTFAHASIAQRTSNKGLFLDVTFRTFGMASPARPEMMRR